MTNVSWAQAQFERAVEFLALQEVGVSDSLLSKTEEGIFLVLPVGLPILSVTFYGLFMAAPIVLFAVFLFFLPIIGFLKGWTLTVTSLLLTLLSWALIWGLYKVFGLMSRNRDLFPRRYFTTLGPEGIAMHFQPWHFPLMNPKESVLWRNVKDISMKTVFLFGVYQTTVIELKSSDGSKALIPFKIAKNVQDDSVNKILDVIENFKNGRKNF